MIQGPLTSGQGLPFLELQLLTQTLELMVRLRHMGESPVCHPGPDLGPCWYVTMEHFTSFPLVSEFLRQNQHTHVTRIARKQVETQTCGARGRQWQGSWWQL